MNQEPINDLDFTLTIFTPRKHLKSYYDMMQKDQINSINAAISAVKNSGYIVGSVSADGNISFSPNPVVHPDSYTARTECKRLSVLNAGKMYIFVHLSGGEYVHPIISTSF